LIEKAIMALNYAKKEGKNEYLFYDEELKEEVEKINYAKSLINRALENDNFIFYFQPYISIKDNKIKGCEALLRIKEKDEVILPGVFIDYAEKKGIIKRIEKVMYDKLVNFYSKEIDIPISFNVSAVSFRDEHHMKMFEFSKDFTIELTEREIANNITFTQYIFEELKSKGFKIAIDDFGSGYSSLSYIKDLSFDTLKIDIAFIRNILKSKKDLAIVKIIINLAKELNLKTIAEGVETKEQVEILKELGCDYIQGFYFAKPMSLEELKRFLKEYNNG